MKEYMKPEVEIIDFTAEAIMGDVDMSGGDVDIGGGDGGGVIRPR